MSDERALVRHVLGWHVVFLHQILQLVVMSLRVVHPRIVRGAGLNQHVVPLVVPVCKRGRCWLPAAEETLSCDLGISNCESESVVQLKHLRQTQALTIPLLELRFLRRRPELVLILVTERAADDTDDKDDLGKDRSRRVDGKMEVVVQLSYPIVSCCSKRSSKALAILFRHS